MQPLLAGVKRDRRGGAVAEDFKVVLQTDEPSEYAYPSLAPACDLLTALCVIGAGGETFVTKEQISDGAMKQIRKDLSALK